MSRRSTRFLWLKALTLATFATILSPVPGRTAERITAYFPPFKDLSVSVHLPQRAKFLLIIPI
jgi:hypothetical protein